MKPTLREILDATLKVVKMTPENYRAIRKSRLARAVEVRQLVCYVGTRYGHTQQQMAELLGIGHSTIKYHNEQAEGHRSYDKEFCNKLDLIMENFEEVSLYHKMLGWVAREKESGELTFFSDKPIDVDGMWHQGCLAYGLPKGYFPQVTYEDSPRSCEITLRLK